MAFADLTIDEQYNLKAAYNEVRLAMEAATLTLNPATMARVGAAIAAIPPAPNTAVVDEFSQYDLLTNFPPYTPLGVKLGLVLNGTAVSGFNIGGTGAYIQKNAQVPLQNSAGSAMGANVTVGVDKSVVQYARMPTTIAPVKDGAVVVVRDWNGNNPINTTASVVSGAVSFCKLAANTQAIISGAAMSVPVTGTYVSKITPTISGGNVTGFVLS